MRIPPSAHSRHEPEIGQQLYMGTAVSTCGAAQTSSVNGFHRYQSPLLNKDCTNLKCDNALKVYYHWREGSCHKYHFLSQHKICLYKYLSIQHRFVTTKHVFCRDKRMLVATKICRDKTFVATKMRLVAAPANDK